MKRSQGAPKRTLWCLLFTYTIPATLYVKQGGRVARLPSFSAKFFRLFRRLPADFLCLANINAIRQTIPKITAVIFNFN